MKIVFYLAVIAILSFGTILNGSENISIVAEFSGKRPGNPTVTSEGRIIISMQPLDGPEYKVVELMANGSIKPFPNVDWADGPEKGMVGFSSVIGVDSDEKGNVYILDMGSATAPAQLVIWDSIDDKLVKVIQVEKSALVANSFIQDFALDSKRGKIYIADTTLGNLVGESKSAIVVLDLISGKSRRVLEADPKLLSPNKKVVVDGSVMGAKREDGSKEPLYLGLNPITIDRENEWVYFGTINGSEIFRIPAASLADEKVTNTDLSAKIEYYSKKRPSDGMIMAHDGNIYVGDVENDAVAISNRDGYHILAQDKKLLSWADGFSISGEYLYIVQNQLHLHPALNEGEEGSTKPYHLVKIKIGQ